MIYKKNFCVAKNSIPNGNFANPFFFPPKQCSPSNLFYSLMEYEFQQVVPVLLTWNFSCLISLFNFVFLYPARDLVTLAFSGNPDDLSRDVCHYSLLCYLTLKNMHLIPNWFFSEFSGSTYVKYPFDSSRGITRANPPAAIWLHASTWPKKSCPVLPCPKRRKSSALSRERILNYVCHHWEYFFRS